MHQGDWLGCIAPTSSMSQSKVCTSSRSGRGMCLNCSLKGSLLLMQISCSVTLVHQSSFPSSAKMSWKAKMSSLVAAAFLGVQLPRPSKFSFSKSFSCCAATIIGSHATSVPRIAFILRAPPLSGEDGGKFSGHSFASQDLGGLPCR